MKFLKSKAFSSFGMMISLFALLLIYPMYERGWTGKLVLSVLFATTMIGSVWAAMEKRVWCWTSLALGLPGLILGLTGDFIDIGMPLLIVSHVFIALFFGFLIVIQLYLIYKSSTVTMEVLYRAVSTYLLLGLFWAFLYNISLLIDPGSFFVNESLLQDGETISLGELIYFSIITLTTLGPGDIVAVSARTRPLVILECLVGPLYLAILIARLVALYSREEKVR